MTNVTISDTVYGISIDPDDGGLITEINHSMITGTTRSIAVYCGSCGGIETFIGNTQLAGSVSVGSSNISCVGAYNGSYVALDSSCQPIP